MTDLVQETEIETDDGIDYFNQAFSEVRKNHNNATPRDVDVLDELGITENDDSEQEEKKESSAEEKTSQPDITQAFEKLQEFEAYKDDLIRLKGFDPEAANKRTEQIFGKLGWLEQQIKESKSNPLSELSSEAFAELNEEYPDITEHLVNGLKRVLTEKRIVEQTPFDPTAFDTAVEARLQQQEHQFKRLLIQAQHPDYEQVLDSDEFNAWKEAQDDAFKAEAARTQDISFAMGAITSFKAFQQAKSEKTQQKQDRLKSAVVPRTSAPVSQQRVTEEDPFDAEFKRVTKHRR